MAKVAAFSATVTPAFKGAIASPRQWVWSSLQLWEQRNCCVVALVLGIRALCTSAQPHSFAFLGGLEKQFWTFLVCCSDLVLLKGLTANVEVFGDF